MLRFRRPSDAAIAARLATGEDPFSYAEVGASLGLSAAREAELSATYAVDRYAFRVGEGRATFERAAQALFAWRQFEVPWLETFGMERPAEPGLSVATLARVLGVWFLNPCRVVATEPLDAARDFAGFSYGTLGGHAERGEENFRVRLDSASGEVTYEISAFSTPALWPVKLASPLARRIQRRFAAASAQALAGAVRL